MANFDAAGKRTTAVFLKVKRDGRTVYIREPYNLVMYNANTNIEFTAIEGQAQPYVDMSSHIAEQYDDILFTDRPIWQATRFGRL